MTVDLGRTSVAQTVAAASPRKIRVLLVIAGLPAGGAERQMALLIRGLDRARYDVGLLIFNAREKVHYRDVWQCPLWFRALSLSRADGWKLAAKTMAGVAKAVADFGPDLVHSSLNVANHAVRLSSILLRWRVPIITSVRADFRVGYARNERLLERMVWRLSSHIVCNSERTRQQMLEDLRIPSSRISTIPNGLDPAFLSDRATARPSWWPEGRVAIVVGRYKVEKNHLPLVAALASLEQRGLLADWHFVFLGEGPLRGEIASAIAETDLERRVVLAEPVADVLPFYRAAQLLIMPSRFEGMPNAALEAQAAGCPVAISAAANGSGVVDPQSGWLIGVDLAGELEAILSLPASRFVDVGRAAQRRVATRYSAEKMIGSTQALYESVLESAQVASTA